MKSTYRGNNKLESENSALKKKLDLYETKISVVNSVEKRVKQISTAISGFQVSELNTYVTENNTELKRISKVLHIQKESIESIKTNSSN